METFELKLNLTVERDNFRLKINIGAPGGWIHDTQIADLIGDCVI